MQNKAKILLEKGDQLKQLGEFEKAIEQYQSALDLNPSFVPALSQLAEIYEQLKEFDRALFFYQSALKIKPDKPKIIRKIALTSTKVLSRKTSIEDAITVYLQIVDSLNLASVKPEVEKLIGKVYEEFGKTILKQSIRQGKFDRAIEFWQVEVKKRPHCPWIHYNLGLVLARSNQIDLAIETYQNSLQIKPDFYQALLELGRLFQAKQDYDNAIQCGIKAIDINPNPRPPYDLLASHSSEQVRKLNKFFNEFVHKTDPAQLHTGGLYIAQQLKQNGNLLAAISCMQKCIYHQLEKTKPEFIDRYWSESQPGEPNFLIIGIGKCGTTALYDYLVQHPQVLPAIIKEPCYFNRLKASVKGIKNIVDFSSLEEERKFYLAHFPPKPSTARFSTGEASVDTIQARLEKLIYFWFPQLKPIVIIRNPVKRLISHYEQGLKGRKEQRSFEKAIVSELEVLEQMEDIESDIFSQNKNLRYVHKGLYLYLLKPWISLFGSDRVLVLLNEDLARQPAELMNTVFQFLELPNCETIDYTPKNVGYYPSSISPELIDRLEKFYEPHNRELEVYLNRKLNW
jgi:tetratricopeptide (TPR) repeat protein